LTAFADLVDAFQREVAIPGTFENTYPDTTDADIEAALADAFAQAQLDGFFPTSLIDTAAGTVAPDLSAPAAALVIIYAGMRWIRAELRSISNVRYKAGPVEYETQYPAALLTQLLKELTLRRDALLEAAKIGRVVDQVMDGFFARVFSPSATPPALTWLPFELPTAGAYGGY
jgi:hypothetical protein